MRPGVAYVAMCIKMFKKNCVQLAIISNVTNTITKELCM